MSVTILQSYVAHYEVLGRGRPLVFLHGWVGSWRYWIPAMQATSVSLRAYALDLWGFGDSARKSEAYSIPGQATMLADFLQEMGIGKIALVGHGLGAGVALNFAQTYPGKVDRLMIVAYPETSTAINPRLSTTNNLTETTDWLLTTATKSSIQLEAQKTDLLALRTSLQSLVDIPLGPMVNQLTLPLLLVYGQNDPLVPEPMLDGLEALPEQAHQILFDQSGHFPMLDEPAKFNRLLADFLTLNPGTSPRQLQLKEEWKRRVR
jgi:pimeloyl-ACP methyl ester carboxylesterase